MVKGIIPTPQDQVVHVLFPNYNLNRVLACIRSARS